jgi:predicted DNA-binding transcriptional regulator AlpA
MWEQDGGLVPRSGIHRLSQRPADSRRVAVIGKLMTGKGATVSAKDVNVIEPSNFPKLKRYLRVAQVRERYGNASDEWIRRKTHEAGFPAPYYIDGADRFWSLEELDAWDAATLKREPSRPRKVVRS